MPDSTERIPLGPDIPVEITRAEVLSVVSRLVLDVIDGNDDILVDLRLLDDCPHAPESFAASRVTLNTVGQSYFARITGYPYLGDLDIQEAAYDVTDQDLVPKPEPEPEAEVIIEHQEGAVLLRGMMSVYLKRTTES